MIDNFCSGSGKLPCSRPPKASSQRRQTPSGAAGGCWRDCRTQVAPMASASPTSAAARLSSPKLSPSRWTRCVSGSPGRLPASRPRPERIPAISSTSITHMNSRPGRLEVPAEENGVFILGDPAYGAVKHHTRHGVRVRTPEEVLDHVRRSFSARMAHRAARPSLISPPSLTVRGAGKKVREGASA